MQHETSALLRGRVALCSFVTVEHLLEGQLDFTAMKPYLNSGSKLVSRLYYPSMRHEVDLVLPTIPDRPKPIPAPEDKMQRSFDLPSPIHLTPVEQYLHLTRTVMPALAQTSKRHWPVRNDHCFQRIVLDTICSGVWYDHIARPAYKHLSQAQAAEAVQLCDQIIAERTDLNVLNKQSLAWRGKGRTAGGS
ncbi:hypothetical protein [Roseinatronobacter monicus]|uniref:hypothetical protein n=1 Tax=Roseinatronobacter monicus TaxID=393481 RepID=UPI003F31AD05